MTYKRHLKPSRLRLGLGFIGFVAGLLLFGYLWQTARLSQWRGNDDFSWVDQQGETLTVHTLVPEYSKEITWIIPGNTMVETALAYGRYQWKNVFALGEIDKRGGEILARTSQDTLGLPISGWRRGSSTNLSWLDRLKWWYWTRINVKHKVSFTLEQDSAWRSASLPDGSRVFEVVDYRLDQLVNQETFSQAVANEALSVTLVNANRLARVISNHGLELVSVTSEPEPAGETVILVKDEARQDSRTVAWLHRLLPQALVKVGTLQNYWTSVVLLVGKDYN